MAQQKADPKAIAVARAVQDAAPDDAVIVLFGSRARGDYHQRSDIDLMVLVPETGMEHSDISLCRSIEKTARTLAQQEYGQEMTVDVINFDHRRFRHCQQAINHVAYDITKDGIPMGELPAAPGDSDDGERRDNWLDTRERIRDAESCLRYMRYALNDEDEKYLGRHGQETLEHAYKALIAALGQAYPRTHDLRVLEARLTDLHGEHRVDIPPSPDWLTYFSGGIRYEHPPQIPEPPLDFFERVAMVKDAIIARVYELTGTSEADLYPDG